MFVIPAALAAATVIGIGCAGTDRTTEAQQAGAAQLGVQMSALEVSELTGITVTVGPGTGSPSFDPIIVPASKNEDGHWSAYISNIPAGEGRTFQVVACTGEAGCDDTTPEENRAYEGMATATVLLGETAQVYIILQATQEPNPFNNYAPVIEGLSASASTVAPGETVQLSVDAYDPDTADGGQGPVDIFWMATCGDILQNTSANPVWTAPSPSEDRDCTLYVTLRDTCADGLPLACQSTVTAALQVRVRNETNGGGDVIVYPNTCPMVTCVAANQKFTYAADGGWVNGYTADVRVVSGDADGDELRYTWSSPDCPNAIFTPDGSNPTGPITDDGTDDSRIVRFTSNTLEACTLRVDVEDYWPNGAPPDAGLEDWRGCTNTGMVYLGAAVDFQVGPSVSITLQPSSTNLVKAGQTYNFAVDIRDDNFKSGYPLTIEWSSKDGMGTFGSYETQLTEAGSSMVQWTAPDTLTDGMSLTVRVTNTYGLYTERTFSLTH